MFLWFKGLKYIYLMIQKDWKKGQANINPLRKMSMCFVASFHVLWLYYHIYDFKITG